MKKDYMSTISTKTINDYRTSLPFISAKQVNREGWITCPNCDERHALFYRRHSPEKRTLNFYCNKVVRRNVENRAGDLDHARLFTVMGECEMVEGLPIKEDWTAKYRQQFQKERHTSLV